jgi:hypothetical protein
MTLPINPNLGEQIADGIQKLRQKRIDEGKVLGKHEVGSFIQAAIIGEFARISEKPAAKPPAAKKPAPQILMPDEAWLAELEANPAYAGVDVKRELGKCQAWSGLRNASVTRRRFINWLNKAEKTVGYNGQGKTSATPTGTISLDPYVEPPEWKRRFTFVFGTDIDVPAKWSDIGLTIRKDILIKTRHL